MAPLIIPLKPVLIFIIVLARTGGLVTFAPFWGHQAVSKQVRVVLAFALGFVLTPVMLEKLPMPPTDPAALIVVVLSELLVGCAFGLVGRLVFSGLEAAAQIVGYQMGFSLGATINPDTQAQTAALGIAAQMLGLIIFMGMDGHHWLLIAAVRSFDHTHPGAAPGGPALAQLLVRLSADALSVGVALAAPAIVMLLAVEFAIALAGRAVPQIQVMILGFPIKIAAGLWLLGASLYFMPGAIRTTISAMQHALSRAIAAL